MTVITEQLEGLLQAQSIALADEHLDKGRAAAARVVEEARERIARRQAREEESYAAQAQRLCRQIRQAAEIRAQTEQDRLRWMLVESVLAEVREGLRRVVEDDARYRQVLTRYLAEASVALPDGKLTAQVATHDLERLRPHWPAMIQAAAPGREVALEAIDAPITGGMRVVAADGRRRVDNTFEGRMARMEAQVRRTIMERLFAEAATS
jgi:V/A-type H+-transporting ATPase subunit E